MTTRTSQQFEAQASIGCTDSPDFARTALSWLAFNEPVATVFSPVGFLVTAGAAWRLLSDSHFLPAFTCSNPMTKASKTSLAERH